MRALRPLPPRRRPAPPAAAAAPPPPPALAPTAAAPLRAAVAAATAALTAATPAAPALADGRDGTGVGPTSTDVKNAIEADFARAYFVTGQIDGAAYDPACAFVDPTVTVRGLAEWRRNIGALKRWLVDPRVELESIAAAADGRSVVAAWRLVTGVALPWAPIVDVRGVTTYELAAADPPLVVRHVEAWRVPPAAAVAQLLRPGGA